MKTKLVSRGRMMAIAIVMTMVVVITSPNAGAHRTYVSDTHDPDSGLITDFLHATAENNHDILSNFWNSDGHSHTFWDDISSADELFYLGHDSPNIFFHAGHGGDGDSYEARDNPIYHTAINMLEGRGIWPNDVSPGSLPGTVGFLGACGSGKISNPMLAEAFMNEGSWVYMGWDDEVQAASNFFYSNCFYGFLTYYEYNIERAWKAAMGCVSPYLWPWTPGMVLYSWNLPESIQDNTKYDYPIYTEYNDPFLPVTKLLPNEHKTWQVQSSHTDDNGAFLYISGIAAPRNQVVYQDNSPGNWEIYHAALKNDDVDRGRLTFNEEVSHNPDTVVDSNGHVHIVWVDNREGDPDIFYTQLDENRNPVISDLNLMNANDEDNGNEQYGPVITIGIDPITSQETIYVFYADQEFPGFGIEEQYYVRGKIFNGITWTDFGRIVPLYIHYDTPIFDKADPVDAAIDGQGDLHLLYSFGSEYQGTRTEILKHFRGRKNIGGGWEFSGPIHLYEISYSVLPYNHLNKIRYPHLTIDNSRNHIHAIFSYDPDPVHYPYWDTHTTYVEYIRGTFGDSLYDADWDPSPTQIGTGQDAGKYTAIASDLLGHVFVVWHDWRSSTDDFGLMFNRLLNPSCEYPHHCWPYQRELFNHASSHQITPSIEYAGDLYIVWADNRNGNYEIYYAENYDLGGEDWTSEIRETYSDGDSTYPSAATSDTVLQVLFGSQSTLYYIGSYKLQNYYNKGADVYIGSYNVVVYLPDFIIMNGQAQAEIWLSSGRFFLQHAEITIIAE